MKPSDNEIELLAAGFAIQHKNGLIRFAHALLEKCASARAIAFDDWLAKHCDSDDLTAYERELAWDAWNAALSAPQASEAVRDAAFEAVRKQLCKLPRYSFFAGAALGSVRRVEDRSGNWIEFDAAHALFDPVSVDAALSAQPGAQKYWLCCGSKDPDHSDPRAPDCFNAAKAKWGTADQHSAAQKNGRA